MFVDRLQKVLQLLAGFLALSLPTADAAQNVNSVIGLFSGLMRAAVIEAAKTEWRKVRPAELACIENQLQHQGASTQMLTHKAFFLPMVA